MLQGAAAHAARIAALDKDVSRIAALDSKVKALSEGLDKEVRDQWYLII